MAEIMYKILQQKKEITLEDIIMQFEIAPSTAYNVQRLLRAICEKHKEECEVKVKNRRTVFVWVKNEETTVNMSIEERQEIEKILNAQPAEK